MRFRREFYTDHKWKYWDKRIKDIKDSKEICDNIVGFLTHYGLKVEIFGDNEGCKCRLYNDEFNIQKFGGTIVSVLTKAINDFIKEYNVVYEQEMHVQAG